MCKEVWKDIKDCDEYLKEIGQQLISFIYVQKVGDLYGKHFNKDK